VEIIFVDLQKYNKKDMKKLSLLLIILVASIYSFSQSISIISGNTDVWCTDSTLCSNVATIKNVSPNNVTVKCKRIIVSMQTGNTNYFCFAGTCFGPGTRVSTTSAAMSPDSTNSTFIGYLNDAGGTQDDTVTYCFFNEADTTDATCYTVIYHFRPTGIPTISAGNGMLLNVYPNPVDFQATFQYSLPKDINSATVIIMNMLGNKVGEFELNTNRNTAVISTADLSNGIYFYSLEVDGRVVSTKKLMVSHQ